MPFPPTSPALGRALAERGYDDPTPVQAAVLTDDAAGRDLLVSAQTGSGKTVAYGLAIGGTILGEAERLDRAGSPIALVVAPTRELALQVERELSWLYAGAGARIVSCVGGMDARRERRELAQGAHIVVGTPGRLRDHLERGGLNLADLKALVLDEADEMLDLGFREDLEFLLEATPTGRRTLLFSATLPKAIVALARRYQNQAFRIEVAASEGGHADIEYRAIRVLGHEIDRAVVNVLRAVDTPTAIVFCNTRESVRTLHSFLADRGFAVVALSGELSQGERNQAMEALRSGRAGVCVATDVAARGIDLPSVGLVIHADLPHDSEVLQHRSGRTGRAGRKGVSVLLVPVSRRRKAESLIAEAGVQPVRGGPPTAEEILRLDQERLLRDPILSSATSDDDAAMARALMAARPAEELVAALVRIYRSQLPAPADLRDPGTGPLRRDDRSVRPERNDRPGRRERVAAREGRVRDEAPFAADHPARQARPPRRDPEVVAAVAEAPAEMASETRQRESDAAPAVRQGGGRRPFGPTTWFRLDIGRSKNADPKWLLPMICRRGEITKKEIGAIRILENETHVEIAEHLAEHFIISARRSKGGGDNFSIEPLDQDVSPRERHTAPRRRPDAGPPRGKKRPKHATAHRKQTSA